MKHSRWRRPSPALVIACLALFVALGGTVLAATKINGKTIKVKSLPGNRLELDSLPANRLKGLVPGNRIDPGSLGQVPNATHAEAADTARHAQTAAAADHAADATTINGRSVGCGDGKREFAGACWDGQPSTTTVPLSEAVAACSAEGGELPATVSLLGFERMPGTQESAQGEWTKDVSITDPANVYYVLVVSEPGFVSFDAVGSHHHYRCVTPLLH
jgi:hypothetical protein